MVAFEMGLAEDALSMQMAKPSHVPAATLAYTFLA